MYCENCGKELKPGADRCAECGHARQVEPPLKDQALALASFVLAMLNFNLAAIVTGIISLVGKRPGKPFAIAGIAVAGLRFVIIVPLVFSMFGLAMFGFMVSRFEEKQEARATQWEEWDEPEMNVDTSWQGRAALFAEEMTADLAGLEALCDDIEAHHGDDGPEVTDAISTAWNEIALARAVVIDLDYAESEERALELMNRAEEHRARARDALDSLDL